MTACKISSGLDCPSCADIRTKSGLINEFYVINMDDMDQATGFKGVTIAFDGDTPYISNLTLNAYTTAYKFCMKKNGGQLVNTLAVSESGYKSWTPTFTGRFLQSDADSRKVLDDLIAGNYLIVVQDFNSRFWVIDYNEGLEVTAAELTTGTAPGDVSGFSFTFSGSVDNLPHQLVVGSGYADTYAFLEGLL